MAEGAHDEIGRRRFAERDDQEGRDHCEGMVRENARIEQHAHRHEEQHRKRIAQGQRFLRGLMAQGRFRQNHAREERTQRERDAKELRRTKGHAQRNRQHRKAEQFARASMAT